MPPIDTDQLHSSITFINVLGKKLRVQTLMQPDEEALQKPYLVFLHEGLGCIELWKGFPEQLAAATGLNTIVFDRQGYGQSDPMNLPRPMDYLQREALDYLPELFQLLKVQKPILVGHSDGGSIALIHAGQHPVHAVITEAAHVYVEELTLKGVEAAKNNDQLPIILDKLKKYHGDKTEDIYSAWADTWLHPDFESWNVEKFLYGIEAPALIIQGKDDQYASEAHVDRILGKLAKAPFKEGFLVEDCGHSPHLEARQAVLEKMEAFISSTL